MNYHVIWEIDVYAEDPVEAAMMARDLQTRSGSTAVVFDVTDELGETRRIDLMEHDDIDED